MIKMVNEDYDIFNVKYEKEVNEFRGDSVVYTDAIYTDFYSVIYNGHHYQYIKRKHSYTNFEKGKQKLDNDDKIVDLNVNEEIEDEKLKELFEKVVAIYESTSTSKNGRKSLRVRHQKIDAYSSLRSYDEIDNELEIKIAKREISVVTGEDDILVKLISTKEDEIRQRIHNGYYYTYDGPVINRYKLNIYYVEYNKIRFFVEKQEYENTLEPRYRIRIAKIDEINNLPESIYFPINDNEYNVYLPVIAVALGKYDYDNEDDTKTYKLDEIEQIRLQKNESEAQQKRINDLKELRQSLIELETASQEVEDNLKETDENLVLKLKK